MAFDVNKFAQLAEQYAPPPQPEEKGIWDTVSGLADGASDFAGNVFNWAEGTISDTVQAAEDFLLAKNYEELQKGKEEMKYLPFRETAREFTAAYADNPDSILQPIAQAIRASETAYNYWQTDEDKLKRAREISTETNLPAETILYDSEAWKSANLVYDDIQSAKQLNVDNGNSWSLEDVYVKYPEIRSIADKDAVSGALILKDVANVGKELDIIDTFTKYLSTGNSQLELNNLRFKAGMGTADENDIQRMQELEKKVEEDNRKNQIRFLDNPLAYAVSGVASSAPEMWQSIYTGLEDAGAWWAAGTWAGAAAGSALPGPGTAAGAAAGGVIGGAIGAIKGAAKVLATKEARNAAIREYLLQRAAKTTAPNLMKLGAKAGAFSGMATPEAGERYAEYSELKDKDGNPLMSKEEAWHRALLGGSANAALEVMPTFGVLGNMLKGAPHASKVVGEIISSNTAEIGAKAMAGTFAKKYGKNVLKIAGVEAGEEGTQAIADDLLSNDIKNTYGRAYTGKDGKLYYTGDALSAYDIVADGLKASLQALPSSFIFGAAGGFAPVAGIAGRYAARARHLSALEKAHGEMARQTYTGTVMAEQLQQAVLDSRLKDTAPDVQRKLIKEKAAGTGFETVYIYTELALEKENGQNDLEAVAKTIGLSQEDLQTAIDTKGTIAVPLECFAQSEASSEVLEAASFSPEAEPMARMQKNAQDVIQRMQELVEKAADHQIKMVDIISRELFPEETQQATVNRELVQAAIIENPENPALGLKTLIEKYKAQKMAILEPALKFLDDTSGNGTVIVPIDDEGHTVRLSEKAKWYQDFWKDFGRKPTKAELIKIAEDMVTGKSNIEYWTITSEEEEQQAKDIMLDIAELNHKLQLLENIKPKMQSINGVEMRLTEGLSAEAYKVYRILSEQLKNAPGTASRAGRISAILFARHADIFAKAMRDNGAADYTALDYLKQHQVVFNQDLSGGMNQANLDVAELSRQVSAKEELLNSTPAINIQDDPLEGMDKKQLKAYFKKKYRNDDGSSAIPVPAIVYTKYGEPVKITVNGTFKEIIRHSADKRVLRLLPYLKEIISNSVFLFDDEPIKNRIKKLNQTTLSYKHYGCKVILDGNPLLIRSTIRVASDGSYYYDVNIDNYEIEKKGSLQRGWPNHNSGAVAKNPSKSAFILSDWLEKVNMLETDFRKNIFSQMAGEYTDKNDTGGGFSTFGMQLYIPAEKLAPVERPLQRALDEFTAQYPDGTIAHTSIGDVRISRRDIKNSLSHGLSAKKIAVISTLKDGIEKAEHVFSMADYDNKQKRNHFFVYTVNVAGEENFVLCRITEQQNQRRLYVHEVVNREEIKKISDSLLTRAVTNKSNPVPRGIALYASILSDYVAKVDSKSAKKTEIFNQGVRGQSAPLSTGGYIMSLLQTADESTFLHESGHLFLWDLEQLAGFGGQYTEDWRVVREWSSYKTGAEKLYKGTPFEKEFATLAQNIRAAEDAGDVNTADSLKRRWMHERFARGFEMYLKQGKAPSKGLQSVFRKFKQFLKTIYIAFTGEGVRANSTVERVMARMIASEDEIEAAELDDRFKDISKAGGEKLMGESTQETYQRWREEAKEEAKEKLMKILMQDLEEEKLRLYDEAIVNERSRMKKELEQMPLYLAQKIISETGNKNAVVELGFYDSVEAYEAELKDTPSLEQALDDYMVEFAKEKDSEIIQAKVSEEKVAELIQQTHYHKKLMALETEIMKSKEEAVNKINAKAKAAMDELDESIKALHDDIDIQLERKTDKSIKKVIYAINKLRFSTRWTPAELARIDDIIHSATKQEMSQALKEFTKQAGEWKKNLKDVQEAFDGRMKMMEKMAEKDLAGRSIGEACSYNTYVTREKKAAKLVDKMVRSGKWDVAMVHQEARFTAAALAAAAKRNQERVNKLLNTVKKQLKARSVKLPKEERYWHRQLAYLLHLIPEAPERPEECPDLKDIFTGLNESLDIDFDIGSIYDIITQESFTIYGSLTIAQLEEVVNAMTVLYKTGRDKFKIKSFDGMLISDVVDEILEDIHSNKGKLPSVEAKAVMDDKGGIGYSELLAKIPRFGEKLSQLGQRYELAMLRPEVLLKILGKSAHKYIMGLYDKAAVDEGRRMAKAIAELSKIMSVYSQKEKKEMRKAKYKLKTGYGIEEFSKENILCMALNYGNKINWLRLCKGLGVEDGNYLRSFLDENMTKKDWLTVQALWDHIGKYWKDTVKVEQELNGVTLKGVEARGFWVTVDGEVLKLRGGYYPIQYNSEKSTKAAEQTVDEEAKRTMSGAQVLGTGRGFTNARSEAKNIALPLSLQLDVISNHVAQVIHNISFRIACRDVYRLTHDSRFQEAVINTLGREALDTIQKWSVDCWRVLPNNNGTVEGFFNKVLAGLRSNAGFAIMGFRMWPAIENITNILPMMDQVGAKNALMAISDFYTDFQKNRKLINLSPFMRERADSIDRDMSSVKTPFEGSGPVSGFLKQYAYAPLVWTDRMLSEPLWCRVYKSSIEKNFIAVHEENQRQLARFRAAQEKVQELKGQMADLVAERAKLRNSLQEDEDNNTPYTPDALRHITSAKIRIAEIEKDLEPMNKKLWEAEREIDLLEKIEVKSQNDILEEAKELSVRDADEAVRNTFGSGKTKDLAPVLREKSELMKMFTVFMSYFNTQMNAIALSYYGGKFAREDLTGLQNFGRWMPFIRSIMYRIFLTALIGSLLKMALTGDGSDDKHKYRKVKDAEGNELTEEIPLLERFLVQFGKNLVSTATGSLIGIREIVGVLNNLAFEGTDYGRGVGGTAIATTCANKAIRAIKLAAAKGDKDAEIEEAERKRKEKYAQMTPAARRKFDEEQKYKKPPQRITYADILKEFAGAVTSATAVRTGVTDTIANTVCTTLQYMMDGDGRYDHALSNMVWSAFWNKKPVEREVPKKPEEPKTKKKGAKK